MPALNAVLSVNPTQLTPGQTGTVQLVLTNTSTSAATITSIQATLNSANAPVNMGLPPYGQGLLASVPANGSVQLNWGIAPFGPSNRYTGGSPASTANPGNMNVDTNPANQDSANYTVGALIQTSDGVVTSAQTQQIQVFVNTIAQPLNGQLVYNTSYNSGFEALGLM